MANFALSKTKFLFGTILLGAVILCVAIFWPKAPQEGDGALSPVPGTRAQLISNIAKRKNAALLAKILHDIKVAHTKVAVAAENNSDQLAKNIETTKFAFNSMHNLRTYAGKYKMRGQILDELLKDVGNVVLSSKVLSDNAFARAQYGASQAVARVYAIELLGRQAAAGDVGPLRDTIVELSRVLGRKSNVAEGENRDLEDLLTKYFKHHRLEKNPSKLAELLKGIPISENMLLTFQNSVHFYLYHALPRPNLKDLIDANIEVS